jgi:HmuY protein
MWLRAVPILPASVLIGKKSNPVKNKAKFMYSNKWFMKTMYLLAALALFSGCRKRDALPPDNYVVFETATQGITPTESAITVKVKLQQSTAVNVPVELNLTQQDLVYGTDYITEPAAPTGKMTLTIPAGSNQASFKLTKVPGALFDGDEKLIFDIYKINEPIQIGLTKQFTLNFAELVATAASATINGGGSTFPNKVFLDLSANRQTPVLRTKWDLGFYCGSDNFRVILNSSNTMMAKQINKNDLAQVGTADTLGFAADVSFSQFNPLPFQLPFIDYPNGDLNRTAIAGIAATATDNKVYIINRGVGITGGSRGWKKIRIIRNASGGYTLQHADIAASSFTSIDVAKDDAYFFKYVSFETGNVPVLEPQKKKWDIAWTYFANITNFGSGEVPYMFQDIIVLNRNTQVAKVLTATKSFADFGEADLTAQTFLTTQNAIAADWRSGGGPTSAPAVRTDRYYIIKDGDNNYYKLRFTGLSQNGERGYPAYESVLVKKG